MSSEMWQTCDADQLPYERTVDGFLGEMFGRWRQLGCNHEVNIVLFSRTFFIPTDPNSPLVLTDFPSDQAESILQKPDGRWYQDRYQVLTQGETRADWTSLGVMVKKEIFEHKNHMTNPFPGSQNDRYSCQPSRAREGNFLEAINFCIAAFDKHYMNRNFERTGQLIVVVSAGVGVFEVSPTLAKLTSQKLMDKGIGCDFVGVSTPPIHMSPLFINEGTETYSIPQWISLSFYTSHDFSAGHQRFRLPRFEAQCGLVDVQDWAVTHLPRK
eukprot:Ihof_evm1s1317 gene=Ihof_evmTU1s1317